MSAQDSVVTDTSIAPATGQLRSHPLAIFLIFLRQGLISFGGPIAHIAYFRTEFVGKRGWLSDSAYADLVALCQFLPGPASSQVGFALGLMRGGLLGALAAFLGFTLPSAALMVGAAYALEYTRDPVVFAIVQSLKYVAVAVVAHAVWSMVQNLCPDRPRASVAVVAAIAVVLVPAPGVAVLVIMLAGLAGLALALSSGAQSGSGLAAPIPRWGAVLAGALFFALLFGLPVLDRLTDGREWAILDAFYRAGALVFGGGHVVLPLLEQAVVDTGLIPRDAFLAGYGAAQAVPGPLFTFAGFLGAAITPPGGIAGAALALAAIFLPGFLLVLATLTSWGALRANAKARSALAGVNAAVVGILAAALYDPIWSGTVFTGADFAIVLGAFAALALWRVPVWLVVLATTAIGSAHYLGMFTPGA